MPMPNAGGVPGGGPGVGVCIGSGCAAVASKVSDAVERNCLRDLGMRLVCPKIKASAPVIEIRKAEDSGLVPDAPLSWDNSDGISPGSINLSRLVVLQYGI